MYDVLIIGAGICGASIARNLSKYSLNVVVLEKENDVANGTTKANSAIIHAGYDTKPGTLMAKYNVLGNRMYEELCKELDVAFEKCGSLVLAFNDEDMEHIHELYERGVVNQIPDMEILNKSEIIKIEPNVKKNVVGALYAKSAGIVGPWELAIAMLEEAVLNDVELKLGEEVLKIEKIDLGYKVTSKKGEYLTKKIVNCAGVNSDIVHNMVGKKSFEIHPRRGQYYVMDKTQGEKVNRTIFQCPTIMGKGVLITPTVHGNLLVGPDSEDIEDRDDLSTTADRLHIVREQSLKSIDNIEFKDSIRTFSGMRAESDRGDFIIEEAIDAKGFYDVAGIKSPGLTAAPAIAVRIVELLRESGLNLIEKENLKKRKEHKIFMELSSNEKNELIKKDSSYGRIVCRCEMITEGEILDVIRRGVGGTTVDGIKRRVRPGTGRCQGGFCGARVQEILAKEQKKSLEDILMDKEGSYILVGKTKK
ncbi:MAG: NAD(P)/FAD-dependent oxidoreductase [Fusobacteriaceae bacterium]